MQSLTCFIAQRLTTGRKGISSGSLIYSAGKTVPAFPNLFICGRNFTTGLNNMLGTTYICAGEVKENGASIIREYVEGMFRGKQLSVDIFNAQMLLGPTVESGYLTNIQGNGLGSYTNGPLGHPGDGEFEIYRLLHTSFAGKLLKEGLGVEIKANTSLGKEVCYFAKEESEEQLILILIRNCINNPLPVAN
jgi:hypothetical protein